MIIYSVPCPQLKNTWELSIMILADSRLKRLSCFNNQEHVAKSVLFVSEPLIHCSLRNLFSLFDFSCPCTILIVNHKILFYLMEIHTYWPPLGQAKCWYLYTFTSDHITFHSPALYLFVKINSLWFLNFEYC